MDFKWQDFWNRRFKEEGKIWGDEVSNSAILAAKIFKEHNIKTVLVPGCGYGRNSIFFAKEGFIVTAFDFSSVALEMAKRTAENLKMNIHYYEGDALDEKSYKERYDGIYSSNLVHLFLKREREILLKNFENAIKKNGLLALNVFSIEDSSYRKGKLIEENTYYSSNGHFNYYFTEESIIKNFPNFELILCEKIEEFETHGEKGRHSHNFLFAVFKK